MIVPLGVRAKLLPHIQWRLTIKISPDVKGIGTLRTYLNKHLFGTDSGHQGIADERRLGQARLLILMKLSDKYLHNISRVRSKKAKVYAQGARVDFSGPNTL